MQTVLLISSNIRVAAEIEKVLQSKKVVLSVCHTLDTAYSKLKSDSYQVVIIVDGFEYLEEYELLEYITEFYFSTRTILVTQQKQTTVRRQAYLSGADDVIVFPMDLIEFWLRMELLFNRRKSYPQQALPLGKHVQLYPEEGVLKIDSRSKMIRPKESEILACLLENKNKVVKRDSIVRWVWRDASFQPKNITLDVYIKRVRIRLEKYSTHLETVRGFGYRINDTV